MTIKELPKTWTELEDVLIANETNTIFNILVSLAIKRSQMLEGIKEGLIEETEFNKGYLEAVFDISVAIDKFLTVNQELLANDKD